MRVTIRYLAQLKRLTGRDQEVAEVDAGTSLVELLTRLAAGRDEQFRRILLSGAAPHPSLLVFVGDEQVPTGTRRTLCEGDVVTLLTPMAGGS